VEAAVAYAKALNAKLAGGKESGPSSEAKVETQDTAIVTEVEGQQLHLAPGTSTGYKGVFSRSKGSYGARVTRNGESIRLGVFNTAIEAAVAYAKHVQELTGRVNVRLSVTASGFVRLELLTLSSREQAHAEPSEGDGEGYFMRLRQPAPPLLPGLNPNGISRKRPNDGEQGSPQDKEGGGARKRARRRDGKRERGRSSPGHDVWAQCERCEKWRRLKDEGQLPDQWYCEMNADAEYASCEVAEEEWDEEDWETDREPSGIVESSDARRFMRTHGFCAVKVDAAGSQVAVPPLHVPSVRPPPASPPLCECSIPAVWLRERWFCSLDRPDGGCTFEVHPVPVPLMPLCHCSKRARLVGWRWWCSHSGSACRFEMEQLPERHDPEAERHVDLEADIARATAALLTANAGCGSSGSLPSQRQETLFEQLRPRGSVAALCDSQEMSPLPYSP